VDNLKGGEAIKEISSGSVMYVNDNYAYSTIVVGDRQVWASNVKGDLYHRPTTISVRALDYELLNQGENKMTNETTTAETIYPDYVIITRNTEVFKKGGVFKNYSSFYAPEDAEEAYVVLPYGDLYQRHDQIKLLLDKKIAIEAVMFSPKFVTVAQNEMLVKALDASMAKKKTANKTVVKAK